MIFERETNHRYFGQLTESLARLIASIVCEPSRNPFRRGPQVRIGAPSAGSEDFHLLFLGKKMVQNDRGTFDCPTDGDGVLVFRSPTLLRSSFLVAADAIGANEKLAAFDKLCTYFFDTRSIEPILPSSLKEFPALYKRLSGQRAELAIDDRDAGTVAVSEGFQFRFTYTALYHSGNPLREDRRVKQRVIDYDTKESERSVI